MRQDRWSIRGWHSSAFEVDFGIAVAVGVGGLRGSLGLGLGRLCFGRGVRGGLITQPIIVGRTGLCLQLETPHRRPGFH